MSKQSFKGTISIRSIINRNKSETASNDDLNNNSNNKESPPPSQTYTAEKMDPLAALNDAVVEGNLQAVQALVNEGVNYSGPIDEEKKTVLHVAAFSGSIPIVEYFLSLKKPGIDVNAVDEHNWTALLCAASVGNIKICGLLLSHGADPKINSDQKTSPLHYLCRKAYVDDSTINLEQQQAITPSSSTTMNSTSSTTSSNTTSKTVLSNSSSSTDDTTSSTISNNTTSSNNNNNNNNNKHRPSTTNLSIAKNKKYFDVLEQLIKMGCDVNAQNYLGETPLMQASSRGNEAAVHFLLHHKAKTNLVNGKGESALYYAERLNYTNIVKLLQEKKDNQKKELITHQNIKLENLADVVNILKGPDGLNLKDRSHFFITHHKSFLGSELIDWTIKNLPIRTREDAVEYAQKLLNAKYIYHVSKKKKFKDADTLYKFTSNDNDTGADDQNQDAKLGKVGIEDFEQLKVLGKGGFGKVILVRKKDTQKIYALKMMDKARILNKPRDFKNLMSEKRILQNDSAFLVHLHWAFQTDTEFYLVMDFVGGGDLYYHWKRVKRFPEKTVQFIAAELVLAISYLHSCGIIYRDLKPQNILLGADGHICLADFGLSKEVQSTEMGIHTACGTPTYSAPEVLDGSPYNKAIDYWSLGIVLYQFLVGKPPFDFDGDFAKLLRSIYTTKIKFPKQFISINAAAFLDGLLQRDVQKRFDDPEIIKRHPFFKGLEWDKIEVKKYPSPIKIVQEDLSQNFDPKYTQMPVNDSSDKPKKIAPEVPDFSVMFGE